MLEISPEAYRQRLARTRARLDGFAGATCGLVNDQASCSCARQLPAMRHLQGRSPLPLPFVAEAADADAGNLAQAEHLLNAFVRTGDIGGVLRAHPQWQAPEQQRQVIRAILQAQGFLGEQRPLH